MYIQTQQYKYNLTAMYRFTMDEFKDDSNKTEIKGKPLALTHLSPFINKAVRGQRMSV